MRISVLSFFALCWLTGCSFELDRSAQEDPLTPLSTTPSLVSPDRLDSLLLLDQAGDPEARDRLQAAVDAYNASGPRRTAVLAIEENYANRLEFELQSQDAPDIFYVDSALLPELVADGRLAPLPASRSWPTDYSATILSAFEVDGEQYCLPRAARPLALFYNRQLFDRFGLPYPTAGWTWTDLANAAEILTDQDADTVGMVLSADFSRWLPFLWQAGGRLFASESGVGEQVAAYDEAGLAALTFYSDLVVNGYGASPLDLGGNWNGDAFGRGRVGMTIEGPWTTPYLAQFYPDLNFGVAPLPAGPGGRGTVAFSGCYAVSSASRDMAAAFDLLAYLTTPDVLAIWTDNGQAVPVRLSLQTDWAADFPEQVAFLDSLSDVWVWQFPPGFQSIFNGVNKDLAQVMNAEMTPDVLLSRLEANGNDALR